MAMFLALPHIYFGAALQMWFSEKTTLIFEGTALVKEPDILIRTLQNVEEMSIGVKLQHRIWGYSAIDTVPDQMFIVAKESGGQVLGAFHKSDAVGFALAFAAIHGRTPYLHSHMVGVAPEFQNQGVGKLLKLAQRDDAIARGIDLIEWTFDPLQLRNAHFNLVRLGAVVRRYIPNFYGQTSSPLHAGLPTDRLVAEWWVNSKRVQAALNNQAYIPKSSELISIPVAINQICTSDPPRAEEIQSGIRRQFESHFAAGRAAVSFELRDQQGSYLLERYED
jgi:predicted GNAT superfamily acetyltransferase